MLPAAGRGGHTYITKSANRARTSCIVPMSLPEGKTLLMKGCSWHSLGRSSTDPEGSQMWSKPQEGCVSMSGLSHEVALEFVGEARIRNTEGNKWQPCPGFCSGQPDANSKGAKVSPAPLTTGLSIAHNCLYFYINSISSKSPSNNTHFPDIHSPPPPPKNHKTTKL